MRERMRGIPAGMAAMMKPALRKVPIRETDPLRALDAIARLIVMENLNQLAYQREGKAKPDAAP